MAIESMNAATVAASSVPQTTQQQLGQAQQAGQVQQPDQAQQAKQVAESEARAKASIQETEDISAEQLQDAIDRLNELMKDGQRSLAFSVDKEQDEVIVKVMDVKTNEVIRQIPNEEALKFAKNLEGVLGVIFNDRA
ncbi:flagellar protein FlaG [Pontibacterium sp.]|uniref:flagellar protein FlaG n=1 Tax=Pontibacterium sp. TaxID=2036026 RepID=UPI00356174ED